MKLEITLAFIALFSFVSRADYKPHSVECSLTGALTKNASFTLYVDKSASSPLFGHAAVWHGIDETPIHGTLDTQVVTDDATYYGHYWLYFKSDSKLSYIVLLGDPEFKEMTGVGEYDDKLVFAECKARE